MLYRYDRVVALCWSPTAPIRRSPMGKMARNETYSIRLFSKTDSWKNTAKENRYAQMSRCTYQDCNKEPQALPNITVCRSLLNITYFRCYGFIGFGLGACAIADKYNHVHVATRRRGSTQLSLTHDKGRNCGSPSTSVFSIVCLR